ncbi:MAG: hypothetical protein DI604_34410, partial [Delftia acidovorans]
MTEAANETPGVAKIVTPKERHIDVPLEWPIEFNGQIYESVRIRRVTGREVEAFIRGATAVGPNDPAPVPPMLDCPAEVYEALDDDDRMTVEEQMLPFLPRRLAAVLASTLATTNTTS